jgi:hypothetical protein
MTSATTAGRFARRLDVTTGTQRPRWLWVLLPALATACGPEDVRVYEAPKDVKVAPPAADPHAGITGRELPATPGTPSLEWDLPAGWQALPASQMRVGHFAITGDNQQKAELTIIPLVGQAGSDLDNVNRWLGQLGAPPLSAEELARRAEPVSIGGREGQLFDLAGPEGQPARKRTLAALQRRDGLAWFYKMTGDDALVAAQKPTLVGFLKTLRFPAATETAAPTTAATPTPPPVAPPAAAASATPPPASPGSADQPAFTVPASWKAQAPGAMQLAKYVPEGAEGKVEITVAVLPGDGGGTAANVNRWRRQLGLPPLAEAELLAALKPLEVAEAETYLANLENPDTGQRMLAAGVLRGGRSWFYKCMGDTAAVAAEQAAFVRFVETTQYDR